MSRSRPKLREITHNEALRQAIAYVMQATGDLGGEKPLVAVDLSEDDSGMYRLVLGVEADLETLDEILSMMRGYYPNGIDRSRLADVKFAHSNGWSGASFRPEKA